MQQPRFPGAATVLGVVVFVGFNMLVWGWFLDKAALWVTGLVLSVVAAVLSYVLSKKA